MASWLKYALFALGGIVLLLSSVIKSKTGKSVSTWIIEKTIGEAKSMRQNTPLSVKEIACRLGFIESTHFSNYFKKHTGVSSALYRKQR